ncbi:MAG: hypothetical protein ACRDVM_01685 [Acidimicrobiia bacterium]
MIMLAVWAFGLAACAGSGAVVGNGGSGSSAPTTLADPDALLVEVRWEGGFAPPDLLVNRLPRFALYGDGTLYFEGAVPMIFPGPMLPPVQQVTIGPEALAEVLQLVEDTGLPEITEERNDEAASLVADAPDTVVIYHDDAGAHSFSVYGLDFVETRDVRVAQLRTLVQNLERLAFESGTPREYRPQRVQVQVAAVEDISDQELANFQPWPLSVTFAELVPSAFDFRCRAFHGEEGERLLGAFSDADTATYWETEDGIIYRILARPLLPGEEACPG